jgi:CRP-like cAMP-binding protein
MPATQILHARQYEEMPKRTDPRLSHPSPSRGAAGGEANALLRGLPSDEMARIEPVIESARPRPHQRLLERGAVVAHVYFPTGGVFLAMTEMANGAAIVSLAIGNEGVLGLHAALGARRSPFQVVCQMPDWLLRIPADTLRAAIVPGGVLDRRLKRQAAFEIAFLSQSAACNRLHAVPQRCARWLLITHDRAQGDGIAITQSSLAQMLGVTRQTVSETVGTLQAASVIHSTPGRIFVENRAALEQLACECYRAVRAPLDEIGLLRRPSKS